MTMSICGNPTAVTVLLVRLLYLWTYGQQRHTDLRSVGRAVKPAKQTNK